MPKSSHATGMTLPFQGVRQSHAAGIDVLQATLVLPTPLSQAFAFFAAAENLEVLEYRLTELQGSGW